MKRFLIVLLTLFVVGCGNQVISLDETLYVSQDDFTAEQLVELGQAIDAWALATDGCVALNMSYERAPAGATTVDGKGRIEGGESGSNAMTSRENDHVWITLDPSQIKDLQVTFAHELGHALGLGAHAPEGLMTAYEEDRHLDFNDDGVVNIDGGTVDAFYYVRGEGCR